MRANISRDNSAVRIPQTPREEPATTSIHSIHQDGEKIDNFGHNLEYPSDLVSTNYFYWRRFFPELEEIYANQAIILEEANNIHKVEICTMQFISLANLVYLVYSY